MKDFNFKDIIVAAATQIMPSFGLNHRFMCELPESSLNSVEDVSILVGLTNAVKGNILIGLPKEAAYDIASGMMGQSVYELNDITLSCLSEFTIMLLNNALSRLRLEETIEVAPPTITTGDDVFIMISRSPSKKLFFKLQNTKFNIAYCLE